MTTAAPLRLVLDPVGDELAAARACESEVFRDAFGNTEEEFEREYGPYVDQTLFLAVMRDDGVAVAASRMIANGPAGLKTLNDVARPPWEVDGARSAAAAGLDLDRTWDVATIGVRREERQGGLCSAALYHGIVNACVANDAEYCVGILDSHVRSLLSALGLQTYMLPGTNTAHYLGSDSSTPLWGNVLKTFARQQDENPDAYRLIRHGIGLDGISLPTDWVWKRGTDAP